MGTAISIYLSRCTADTGRERERELGRLVMIGVRCSQVIGVVVFSLSGSFLEIGSKH
jgi:hypothetical protein